MTGDNDDNIIYIGAKPMTNYVLAMMVVLSEKGKTVQIKARGRAISKAVDVAEIVKNRFIEGAKVDSVTTSTEKMGPEEALVSAITITMSR